MKRQAVVFTLRMANPSRTATAVIAISVTLAIVALGLALRSASLRLRWERRKQRLTIEAIVDAILREPAEPDDRTPLVETGTLEPPRSRFFTADLFNILKIRLSPIWSTNISVLRIQSFGLETASYHEHFSAADAIIPLSASGLSLSGSTFYKTRDNAFLIKSLDRTFEYRFVYQSLVPCYLQYIPKCPESTLCRITDLLGNFNHRLGEWFRMSPNHYLVMENLLAPLLRSDIFNGSCITEPTPRTTPASTLTASHADDTEPTSWQTWDLKPKYFEPVVDTLPESVVPSGLKSEYLSEDQKLCVTPEQKSSLLEQLRKDTNFLAGLEVVDYSILFARQPVKEAQRPKLEKHLHSRSGTEDNEGPWRRGMLSTDGHWIYRVALIDYVWCLRSSRGFVTKEAMSKTGVPRQTITAEPGDYARRVVEMMDRYMITEGQF